jgi:hypothetical protein
VKDKAGSLKTKLHASSAKRTLAGERSLNFKDHFYYSFKLKQKTKTTSF